MFVSVLTLSHLIHSEEMQQAVANVPVVLIDQVLLNDSTESSSVFEIPASHPWSARKRRVPKDMAYLIYTSGSTGTRPSTNQ